jgi:polygalacturonase
MSVLKRLVLVGLCIVLCSNTVFSKPDKYSHLYQKLPFAMKEVQSPQIPNLTMSVSDFGGVGDGVALNTAAFAKAIRPEGVAN